jgi:hypothetical protein
MKSIVDNFEERQFLKYSDAFNFFLAKPINLILSEKRIDFVVAFKDHEFFIDELEYLKRYYTHLEIEPRIEKLTGT